MLFEFDSFGEGPCGGRAILVQFAGEIEDGQGKALHFKTVPADSPDDLVVMILINNVDNLYGMKGRLFPNLYFLGQHFGAFDHLLFELHG